MSEQEKFEEWLENEKKNGLKNMHVSFADDVGPDTDREAIYKELNALNEAIARGDGEPLKFNDSRKFSEDDPRHGCDDCCDHKVCWPDAKSVEDGRKAQQIIMRQIAKHVK